MTAISYMNIKMHVHSRLWACKVATKTWVDPMKINKKLQTCQKYKVKKCQ